MICPIFLRAHSPEGARLAIQTDTAAYTYQELDIILSNCEKHLRSLNLKPGTVLGITTQATMRQIAMVWASFRLRYPVCLISPKWPNTYTHSIVSPILHYHELSLTDFSDTDLFDGLSIHSTYDVYSPKTPDTPNSDTSSPPTLSPLQLATFIATSGSSGPPKLIAHTLAAHIESAKLSQEILPILPGDKWLLSLPFFHVSGLSILFRCFLYGGCAVITHEKNPFTAASSYGISHLSLVPTQLKRLLAESEAVPTTIRHVLVGGGTTPPEIIQSAILRNIPIHLTYGMTEFASQIATSHTGEAAVHFLPGYCYKFVEGRLFLKSATMAEGVLQKDGKLYRTLDSEGYFDTSDFGKMTDTSLQILGRKSDMFICKGENIYPQEIESALLSHPMIQHAVVVSIPDPDYGEIGIAFIDPYVNNKEIFEYLLSILPTYKLPKRTVPIPKGLLSSLKPSRARLKEYAKTYCI